MSTEHLWYARGGPLQNRARNRRRAAIVRTAHGRPENPAPVVPPAVDAAPVELTKAQVIALLTLSRGQRNQLQPQMRRYFLRLQLIVPRSYELTAHGHKSLGASRWLEAAQQALDAGRRVP